MTINVNENIGNLKFVKPSYRAADALKRREAVQTALATIEKAVNETGGDMPFDLINRYERLNDTAQEILTGENDVMRVGK